MHTQHMTPGQWVQLDVTHYLRDTHILSYTPSPIIITIPPLHLIIPPPSPPPRYGICCIVPPEDFQPPFAIDSGANGIGADDFMFNIRKQPTSQLCVRDPIIPGSPSPPHDAMDGVEEEEERVDKEEGVEGEQGVEGMKHEGAQGIQINGAAGNTHHAEHEEHASEATGHPLGHPHATHHAATHNTASDTAAVGNGDAHNTHGGGYPEGSPTVGDPEEGPRVVGRSKYGGARSRRAADEECQETTREFGFVTLPDAMSFKQFAVVADWVKDRHFRCPLPKVCFVCVCVCVCVCVVCVWWLCVCGAMSCV